MIKFSILICHLPQRHIKLSNLLACLEPWKTDEVEVLIDADAGTTGAKRNRLLDKSCGQYVAFVDDDDIVVPEYQSLIMEGINMGVDCVGIQGILLENDMPEHLNTWRFRHSVTVTNWCKDKGAKIYFRTPNHLNPVKREYACATRFPDITIGEDRVYSNNLKRHLKTEHFIEQTIYHYNIYPKG